METKETGGPDFIEPEEDDPATADVDESMPDNEHVFVVSVSDGSLSDSFEFTLSVTDVETPLVARGLQFPEYLRIRMKGVENKH